MNPGLRHREIESLVERQMRNWEIGRDQSASESKAKRPEVEYFICLSRAVGVPGEEVAEQLHQKLGWPVFDREILRVMAGSDEVRQRIYEELDERDIGWLESVLRELHLRRSVTAEDYFHQLTLTVNGLARKSHSIFLGRATDLILPRDTGLRVRLTANPHECVGRYAEEKNLPIEAAARSVDEIERERARFVETHFQVAASDPNRHDLTINMKRFDIAQAVEVILSACQSCGIKI